MCVLWCCREDRQAFNMHWLKNDTVLKYSTNITYSWDPTLSNGHPDNDIITTINVPLFVSQGGEE